MEWDSQQAYCKDLPTTPIPETGIILVTGATGYIGGRLVPELIARGYKLRVMVRTHSDEYLERWPGAELIVADATDADQLRKALENVSVAFYLIHSMMVAKKRFMPTEELVVKNFRMVAEEMRVSRIIYLGTQGIENVELKGRYKHRIKVGAILEQGKVPVTILQTPLTIGSGSGSFELLSHIVRNYPVMFVPYWVDKKCRPIGISDLIKIMVGVLETPDTAGKSYMVGGEDVLTYREMIRVMAGLLNKKRLLLPSPFSGIRFNSYLLSLFTPVPAQVLAYILRSIKKREGCSEYELRDKIDIKFISFEETLRRALILSQQDAILTRWSDAYPPAHELSVKLTELSETPRYLSEYSILTKKPVPDIYQSICQIGGNNGWFNTNWMWRLRGFIDRILLGVGTSRGRRSVSSLRINDVIDFWRVEDMICDEKLLLRAEMIVPGKAWLEFIVQQDDGQNKISVKAYFEPKGMAGKLYWYCFLPFHYFIFNDLLKQLSK